MFPFYYDIYSLCWVSAERMNFDQLVSCLFPKRVRDRLRNLWRWVVNRKGFFPKFFAFEGHCGLLARCQIIKVLPLPPYYAGAGCWLLLSCLLHNLHHWICSTGYVPLDMYHWVRVQIDKLGHWLWAARNVALCTRTLLVNSPEWVCATV